MQLELAWISGATDRPLIVFLHEALGSISLWKEFPHRLCQALQSPGLVYSRSGHGSSHPRVPAAYELDYLEREAEQALPALLDSLGVAKGYVLFGHSDGASIALLHAAAFPDRVRGVVALAPHIFVEDVTVAGVHAAGNAWRNSPLPTRLARHHADAGAAFQRWQERWTDPAFRDWNIEQKLDRIRCPVLAVQGENDEYATMAQIDGIASRVARCALLKLPSCGHSPHRDCPDAVISATRRFVDHLPRSMDISDADR